MLVGVISDTHGLLRPEALAALHGADCVIHAGDIGGGEVLDRLAELAPVYAIRGNNDGAAWAAQLPDTRTLEFAGVSVYVIHDVHDLRRQPPASAVQVVISGHSHSPQAREEAGVLYLNPGSAGPRRFRLPVCIAHLHIERRIPKAKIIELDVV
jgi:putative phosphoesterase